MDVCLKYAARTSDDMLVVMVVGCGGGGIVILHLFPLVIGYRSWQNHASRPSPSLSVRVGRDVVTPTFHHEKQEALQSHITSEPHIHQPPTSVSLPPEARVLTTITLVSFVFRVLSSMD